MNQDAVRRLLDQIGIIRHPSDLDLLLFFARHRRALLTSEHLSSLLGYEPKRMAGALDVLIGAGLLKRTQNPALTARLYVLNSPGPNGGWLPSFLQFALTREGRRAVAEALPDRTGETESDGSVSETRDRIALVRP